MVTFDYLRLLEYEMESTSDHMGIRRIVDFKRDACISISKRLVWINGYLLMTLLVLVDIQG